MANPGLRILVAGWIGSTNLGDELIFSGLQRLLHQRGANTAAISIDPAGTRATHGCGAVSGNNPLDVVAAIGTCDGLIFGGGGLLQDETSAFNLPYHLARPGIAAARGRPWAGVGLGAGPLTTNNAKRAVTLLNRASSLTVRDDASAALLESCGVTDVAVAADLAWALDPMDSPGDDVVTVSVRPWQGSRADGGGSALPVALTQRLQGSGEVNRDDDSSAEQVGMAPELLDAWADSLDAIATGTGLGIRFVNLQADRDNAVAEAIAYRMSHTPEVSSPRLRSLVRTLGSGQAAISMRYHGLIGAGLAGRPSVGVAYSPKVSAVGHQLSMETVTPDLGGIAQLPGALEALLDAGDEPRERVQAARDDLRTASVKGNGAAIDQLLEEIITRA